MNINDPASGVVPANDLKTPERRLARRPRVLLTGKIVYGSGFTMDCAVRNLTEGGAKLSVPDGQSAPDSFHLVVVKVGMAYQAEIVWRDWPFTGVRFGGAFDLSNPPAQALAMRELWMQILPR